MRRNIIVITAAVGLVGLGITGTVSARRMLDRDEPITGPAYERAVAAALERTGQGRVTGTEVGDEDSYYEVEVTLDDGRQVDIQLDEQFQVVELTPDVESPDDDDGSD